MTDRLISKIEGRLAATKQSARAASMKAGMGSDGIRNILRGKSENPRGDTLVKLAEVLQCSVAYLLGTEGEAEPPPPTDKNGSPLEIRARRFRVARLAYYESAEEAAAELGIPAEDLERIESGAAPLTDALIMRFAAATETPLDWLLLGKITAAMRAEMAARIALFDPHLVEGLPSAKTTREGEGGK